jgi:hypothetical protein
MVTDRVLFARRLCAETVSRAVRTSGNAKVIAVETSVASVACVSLDYSP